MVLNSNQIQEIIPHRYPFLLIDRIDELEPGKRALGVKCVSANEMQFMGHFPQQHVMPGVLIIEALAQVGAVAILSLEDNKEKSHTLLESNQQNSVKKSFQAMFSH